MVTAKLFLNLEQLIVLQDGRNHQLAGESHSFNFALAHTKAL